MTITVTVKRVNIPAFSTVGYGEGTDDQGRTISFIGDHRPLRDIGEAISAARDAHDLPIVDLDASQITSIEGN